MSGHASEIRKNAIRKWMRRRWRGTSLAGVTAAFTTLPVIGVPILGKATDGLDSLLSMVQMPLGVPVAINGARNAGLWRFKSSPTARCDYTVVSS